MPDENDEQFLLTVAYYNGDQKAYMFFTRKAVQDAFNVVRHDNVIFSIAVFECGKFGSVFEKIAERRPMNVAGAR